MVPLPVSRDVDRVDICQKSKMAVAKMKSADFAAIWLKKYNFLYPVSEFKCPRLHVLKDKQTTTYGTC